MNPLATDPWNNYDSYYNPDYAWPLASMNYGYPPESYWNENGNLALNLEKNSGIDPDLIDNDDDNYSDEIPYIEHYLTPEADQDREVRNECAAGCICEDYHMEFPEVTDANVNVKGKLKIGWRGARAVRTKVVEKNIPDDVPWNVHIRPARAKRVQPEAQVTKCTNMFDDLASESEVDEPAKDEKPATKDENVVIEIEKNIITQADDATKTNESSAEVRKKTTRNMRRRRLMKGKINPKKRPKEVKSNKITNLNLECNIDDGKLNDAGKKDCGEVQRQPNAIATGSNCVPQWRMPRVDDQMFDWNCLDGCDDDDETPPLMDSDSDTEGYYFQLFESSDNEEDVPNTTIGRLSP